MFGIPRARLLLYAGCLAVGLSVLLWPSHSGAPTAYDAQLRTIWHRKMAADAQALREARAAVVHDSIHVARDVYRYRTIRDTTRLTDTVWVKAALASADSVAKSCTELQSSCALYHVRAESVIAGLQTENDALAAEVKASHGSRLGNAWSRVKLPLAFVAGAYIGAKVTR